MHPANYFQDLIESELSNLKLDGKPPRLYDPIKYMISLGGKRLRPALLLMSNELFDGNYSDVIKPALGIEVFHNFTLLHDDIMDKAPLRRSQQTVHKKWNPDIAILSGDTMFVQSCILMMGINKMFLNDALEIFFRTAIQVCEGQQWDMDFEIDEHVSIDDYIKMISLKTAVLLGCAAYIGSLSAGADKKNADHMFEFGKNLGIAFQLHDDILDVYGDMDKFGKQIGGDILANKKTFLLLTALSLAEGKNKSELMRWMQEKDFNPAAKIDAVISIYNELNVKQKSLSKMDLYFKKAIEELEAVSVSSDKKEPLRELAEKLMVREK